MNLYETKFEPAKEVKRQIGIICDLCKVRNKRCYGWGADQYDRNETEIKRRIGTVFPEGGDVQETEVQLCPDCFDNKLLPWLIAQGVQPQVTEIDY